MLPPACSWCPELGQTLQPGPVGRWEPWPPRSQPTCGSPCGCGRRHEPCCWVTWAARHSGASPGCPPVDRGWPVGRWLGEQRLPEEMSPSLAKAFTCPPFPEPLLRDGSGDVAWLRSLEPRFSHPWVEPGHQHSILGKSLTFSVPPFPHQ